MSAPAVARSSTAGGAARQSTSASSSADPLEQVTATVNQPGETVVGGSVTVEPYAYAGTNTIVPWIGASSSWTTPT